MLKKFVNLFKHNLEKKIKGSQLFTVFVDAEGESLRPSISDPVQFGRESHCSI